MRFVHSSRRSIRSRLAFVTALWAVPFAACGSDDASGPPSECNPLGGTTCMMPWPSSAYLAEDSSTVTGYRLDIPLEAMPTNVDGRTIDPTPWNRMDGFSVAGAILAAFPQGVSADGLVPHSDPGQSLADDSLTALVNMDTGERVLHFAEVDMGVDDPLQRILLIRPLIRLEPATRYAVGIRTGVMGGDGAPLTRPEVFQTVLDGDSIAHPRFDAATEHSAEVVSALAGAGMAQNDLILAWDFVTASDEALTADLLAMREQALPAMGEAGANLTFDAEELAGNVDLTYRMLLGTYDAPNFMSDGESDNSIIVRDGADVPAMDGMYDANFAATIPACVTTAALPIPVVLFGHGLFGSAEDYVNDNFLQEIANDNCVVVVAGDFIGLTERQITSAALSANDLNRSHALVEKLGQSVINFIALEHIIRGPMATSPEFAFEGTPIMDPSRLYYLGASLGGIMGNTFMAYDPYIERGALGVPGANWSLLIERSYAWTPLKIAAIGAYEDQYEYQLLVSFLAFSMERWDPITTARRVLDDPLPGTPAKQILIYEAINDSLVSNLATEMVARTMGIQVTGPSIKVPYGMQEVMEPTDSAMSVYDEQVPPVPDINVPPSRDNGTHAGVNDRPAVLRQVVTFLLDGVVTNECEVDGQPAPCDCAAGACE